MLYARLLDENLHEIDEYPRQEVGIDQEVAAEWPRGEVIPKYFGFFDEDDELVCYHILTFPETDTIAITHLAFQGEEEIDLEEISAG